MGFMDITGQKFGKWKVLHRIENTPSREAQFLCKCDCGTIKGVSGKSLRLHRSKSCGCWYSTPIKDLVRKTFGRLLVIEQAKDSHSGKTQFLCQCICGNRVIIRSDSLVSGNTRSCGCLLSDTTRERATVHGENSFRNHSFEYNKWRGMKDRCYNKLHNKYHRYGGRGIIVCDRWLSSYENFLGDMGRCPKGLTIERIDNDENYEPGNCKWATVHTQSRNKITNQWLTFDGRNKIITDWATEWGVSVGKIKYHLRKGRTMEIIFNEYVCMR